jgi:hypothetical protein
MTLKPNLRRLETTLAAALLIALTFLSRPYGASAGGAALDSILRQEVPLPADGQPGWGQSVSWIKDELRLCASRKTFYGSCLLGSGAACAAIGVFNFLVPAIQSRGNGSTDAGLARAGKASIGLATLAFSCVQLSYGSKGVKAAVSDWQTFSGIKHAPMVSAAHPSDLSSNSNFSLDNRGIFIEKE